MAGTTADGLEDRLAPYAVSSRNSRGRMHREPPPAHRSDFQRDRDRIIHSTAFRRLEYKTQVFVNHEGDLFRTRLTHSIEVAQIGRTIARALRLNEDLVEAIALAHDLGHTAFGHAGQEALNACMKPWGGFEHNLQSLRVVDELERRYAEFPGLNLCFETREGILKHCSPARASALGDIAQRFLDGTHPPLEAQLANLADEIAYNNHDIDDGLRSGLLELEPLCETALFGRYWKEVHDRYPELRGRAQIHETIRRMIDHMVRDLIDETTRRLDAAAPASLDEVRKAEGPLVAFSDAQQHMNLELKQFLRHNLYEHYRVRRMTGKARRVIHDLFEAFMNDYRLLPPEYQEHCRNKRARHGESGLARGIADYIAGMTDRYAILEHHRLFDPDHVS
ncbi:MAG: deoxyguanosinetriphosphate triphosphohydrolase [Gammaproteobacteria bacterium]|nr:MAG: deoxyguanosinetriphosphate triphosphohydrolase [Gammaproteobacteria bacterium]